MLAESTVGSYLFASAPLRAGINPAGNPLQAAVKCRIQSSVAWGAVAGKQGAGSEEQ
jgi:hypothetical protein